MPRERGNWDASMMYLVTKWQTTEHKYMFLKAKYLVNASHTRLAVLSLSQRSQQRKALRELILGS